MSRIVVRLQVDDVMVSKVRVIIDSVFWSRRDRIVRLKARVVREVKVLSR
jgi:hypothetical protein